MALMVNYICTAREEWSFSLLSGSHCQLVSFLTQDGYLPHLTSLIGTLIIKNKRGKGFIIAT